MEGHGLALVKVGLIGTDNTLAVILDDSVALVFYPGIFSTWFFCLGIELGCQFLARWPSGIRAVLARMAPNWRKETCLLGI